jgi:hypothetical protein
VSRPRAAAAARLACAVLAAALASCGSCPPGWMEHPPDQPGWLLASGSCGEVFVGADARSIALTRAARRLADRLGLDVEQRLSVVKKDDRLFVEAWGPQGPVHDLDGLQLVDEAKCRKSTYVLVRIKAP